jgi:hypothetical protein
MGTVVVLLVVLLVIGIAVRVLQQRRSSLVPKRGTSIGADLGALSDQPRVRVREVTTIGPDRVRLVLAPETDPADGPGLTTPSDLALVVSLREEEPGFELLHQWKRSASSLAIVIPPDSHLVRLRSIDDLQPLTLRRVDEA